MSRHRSRSAAVAAVALGVTAFVGGCGSSASERVDQGSTTSSITVEDPHVENFRQPAELSIEIGGHHTISFHDQSNLNVLRATGPEDIRLMTVGTFEGVRAGDWTIHEAFLNLVHFSGNGTYKITAPEPHTGKPAMADNAYVTVSRAEAGNPVADAGRFDVLVKSCTATLKRDGLEGTLVCDGLADDRGNVVTVRMAWKPTGKSFDLLADAQSKATGR
ncbi:MAG: hypothetical protein ACT452_08665 [Microthrixaceae bacterium]